MIIDWLIAGLVAFGVVIILGVMVYSFTEHKIVTDTIEPEIYLAALHYSPEILNTVDTQTQVVRTGVIDTAKFTSAHLDESMQQQRMGAKLTLYDKQKKPIMGPVYNNEQLYGRYEAIARVELKGAGGASLTEAFLPVLYHQNGNDYPGYLEITIVRPKQ